MDGPLNPVAVFHPSFLEASRYHLASPRCVLGEAGRARWGAALDGAQSRSASVEETACRLLTELQEHFIGILGGRVTRRYPLPELPGFRTAGIEIPADWSVTELVARPSPGYSERLWQLTRRIFDAVGSQIDPGLRLIQDGGDGTDLLRFLPPPFLLGAARLLFGPQAVGIEVTPSLSETEDVRRMWGEERRPFCLDTLQRDIHGTSGLHPYPVALHEIYHVLLWSRQTPELRADARLIYDTLKELPGGLLPGGCSMETPLGALLDGPELNRPNPYYPLFVKIAIYLTPRFRQELRRALSENFQENPRRDQVLAGLDSVV